MKSISSYNPALTFFYIITCALIPVFSVNPVLLCSSLFFAVCFYFQTVHKPDYKFILFTLAVFILISCINPVFSHNGLTVLFMLDDNPVTLEAFLYGMAIACAVICSIYWFASFSVIMTSDKIMYVFGSFSPKTALLISMTLRFVPLFRLRAAAATDAQRLSGEFDNDDYAQNQRKKLRVFSSVITWALETGIVTADSMEARGYNCAKRTRFAIYRFDFHDTILTVFSAVFLIVYIFCGILTNYSFQFYPYLSGFECDTYCVIQYITYFIIAAIPVVFTLGEKIKWKYLTSKI